MNAQQARDRVAKLREVRVDRGASPSEARVAQRKAIALEQRYGLHRTPTTVGFEGRPYPRARPAPAAAYAFAAKMPNWNFDVQTGEHSDNVKVHFYESPGRWRIEINDDEEQQS